MAIERVLGKGTPVVAPKLALGETLGAGGAMGMLAAIAYFHGAPLCHVVRAGTRERGRSRGRTRCEAPFAPPARVALVTSLGYYGNASALVMRAASR